MSHQDDQRSKNQEFHVQGLHINALNYIFIIGLLCLVSLLYLISTSQSSEYDEGTAITDNYHRFEQDSRMVQAASDYLTKCVQYYVMTGDVKYLDDYFTEANETKRRENAIEDLKQMEETDSLLVYLEKSVDESMALMQLEYTAMRYAAEGYAYDISTLPEEVQNTQLPSSASSMSDEEKKQQARDIVFGIDYEGYKNRIAEYEAQYEKEVTDLMDELQADGRHDMKRLLLFQRIAILVIVILGVVLFLTIARMVVHPLKHAVIHIADGEKISPINGTYEIQYMSNTYNNFHRDSVEIQKQLKHDAERDALTGVLNRRGYHTVINRLSLETFPVALLLIDVDNFKTINDTYGHSMGDEALKDIAQKLLKTFRNTDITSRIGGDEFAVILSEVTAENRSAIEKKINALNEQLQAPDSDDFPKLSLSVGCAFSAVGYNDHLFNEADGNMYHAKQSGGARITFTH